MSTEVLTYQFAVEDEVRFFPTPGNGSTFFLVGMIKKQLFQVFYEGSGEECGYEEDHKNRLP